MWRATEKVEHGPCYFEDLISDADFLDDDAYAFYVKCERAPTRRSKIAGELAGVLILAIVVSLSVPLLLLSDALHA